MRPPPRPPQESDSPMDRHHAFGLALAALLAGLAGLTHRAMARPLGVVELFTSQGCNSCPPADAVLADLADRGDIVALAYHIDYWDYLGWKDTLGSRPNTRRQYRYAKAFGDPSVYTPEAVIDGRANVNGAKADAIRGALSRLKAAGKGLNIDVTANYGGNGLIVETSGGAGGRTNAKIVLVSFAPKKTVRILHGENRGRTMVYRNAVTSIEFAGDWNGKPGRIEIPANLAGDCRPGGCAVLFQEMKDGGLPGAILGAAFVGQPTG